MLYASQRCASHHYSRRLSLAVPPRKCATAVCVLIWIFSFKYIHFKRHVHNCFCFHGISAENNFNQFITSSFFCIWFCSGYRIFSSFSSQFFTELTLNCPSDVRAWKYRDTCTLLHQLTVVVCSPCCSVVQNHLCINSHVRNQEHTPFCCSDDLTPCCSVYLVPQPLILSIPSPFINLFCLWITKWFFDSRSDHSI